MGSLQSCSVGASAGLSEAALISPSNLIRGFCTITCMVHLDFPLRIPELIVYWLYFKILQSQYVITTSCCLLCFPQLFFGPAIITEKWFENPERHGKFFFYYKSLKFGSRNDCSTIYGVFVVEGVPNIVYKLCLKGGSLAAEMG